MESREFKALFGEIAKSHGFGVAGGGWYRQTPAALIVLELQKSNFGAYFEMNIKLFLGQGLPGSRDEQKKLVKRLSGDVFRRQRKEDRDVFDLDAALSDADRRHRLECMFSELVDRIVTAAVDSRGLLRLRDEGVLFLLPMAEARLTAE